MPLACGDGCGVCDACDLHRHRRINIYSASAVSEPAFVGVAPAGYGAVLMERARMLVACGDGCGIGYPHNPHGYYRAGFVAVA